MDIQDVIRRIESIKSKSTYDPEVAHGKEDDLYLDVLVAIAEGAPNAKELAAEAIKTQGIDFPRWCA